MSFFKTLFATPEMVRDGFNAVTIMDRLEEPKKVAQPPRCHMKPMKYEWADDGCMQVEYWLCEHCGHTKEIARTLAG